MDNSTSEKYLSVPSSNIDEKLDKPEKSNKSFLFISACTANLSSFALGLALGWTSPVLPKLRTTSPENALPNPITAEQESWIGSLLPLGAILGPFLAGQIADKIGRKNTIILSTSTFAIAFILYAYANSVYIIYFGRFISGIGVGGICTVLAPYVAEISEDSVRGTLGTFMQLFIVIGVLFSFAIGPYIELKTFNLMCSVPVLIFLVTFYVFIPESAYYLLAKGRKVEARESLMQLRGTRHIESELICIKTEIEQSMSKKANLSDIFKLPGTRKAFIISNMLLALQQFSGINVILFYTQSIFAATGSSIQPEIASIVVGIVQILASLLAPILVDRSGKRFLLLTSAISTAISLAVLGAYFYLKDSTTYDISSLFWLPVMCLVCFIIGYCMGFGPLPWVLMAELFKPEYKSIASSISAANCWLLAFIITKFFGNVSMWIGSSGSFWIFGLCCAGGALYIFKFVPETTCKSLQEVQNLLESGKLS